MITVSAMLNGLPSRFARIQAQAATSPRARGRFTISGAMLAIP